MRVLAVDPGGTTGLALYDSRLEEHMRAWSIAGQMEAVESVREQMSLARLDALVVEEFRINAATIRKSRGGPNTAIEIIGALRWVAHARHVPFATQTPADAKSFSTDEKLRRLGWYASNEHARDAVRHLVLYLARAGALGASRLLGVVSSGEEGGSTCP